MKKRVLWVFLCLVLIGILVIDPGQTIALLVAVIAAAFGTMIQRAI